jgi:hypothetical protein
LFHELKFQYALYAVGGFLIVFGLLAGVLNSGGAVGGGSVLESLSFGFTSVFFALFSGVLIGVGVMYLVTGLVINLRGNVTHVLMCFLLSVLSMLIAIAAVVEAAASSFPTLVLFFAGMAAAGAFLLAAVAFVMANAMRKFIARAR